MSDQDINQTDDESQAPVDNDEPLELDDDFEDISPDEIDEFDEIEFEDLDLIEFVDNPEPRCPVVLILDRSASMHGEKITQLNDGLQAFSKSVKNDELASLRIEIAIVTFGPVRVMDVREGTNEEIPADTELAFVIAGDFVPPVLTAMGGTPMGEAVDLALDLLRDRKDIYKANGIDYFRLWIFLITDGFPTDGTRWKDAAERVMQEEERKGLVFFGIGVEHADMKKLAKFSNQRPPAKLQGLAFGELFQWLSKSVTAVAQAEPGDQIPLPPVCWGEVDTTT